jgi:hypothetical protein
MYEIYDALFVILIIVFDGYEHIYFGSYVPASKSQRLPPSSYLIETACPETLALRTRLHGLEERNSLCSKRQNMDCSKRNIVLKKGK